MNFLQRINKAKVIYEPNQKLEIKTSFLSRYFFGFFYGLLLPSVALIEVILGFKAWVIVIPALIITLWQFVNIAGFISEMSANSKQALLLHKNTNQLNLINPKNTYQQLQKSKFLQVLVKLNQNSIRIKITNGIQEIGKYRLNNTEDLKNVLDGLMEIGDIEVIESFNISNGEVLQLKPKNKQLQKFSSLKISEVNNLINVLSISNPSNWFNINKNKNLIETQYKKIQISNIERIIIQRKYRKVAVFLVSKNKTKKVKLFQHKPTEVIAITDVRRLKDFFQQEILFNNINIEVFN